MNDWAAVRDQVARSNNKTQRYIDVEYRSEQAREARIDREQRRRKRVLQQEQEDRERYIIPEYQDLDDLLTDHL